MVQKNPAFSTNFGRVIRLTLILFGCFIVLDLFQYRQYEYLTSPLRILLWEKIPIFFLALSFIGKTIYYYQKKLYNASWKILLMGNDLVLRLIFSIFEVFVFFLEVGCVIYFSQPESVKIDWAIFAVTMFSFYWFSEKIGYWLAMMTYTDKFKYPNYQEYLGAW